MTDTLIPFDIIQERFNISHVTLWRRMRAAGVKPVKYKGGKAVRWGDLDKVFPRAGEDDARLRIPASD